MFLLLGINDLVLAVLALLTGSGGVFAALMGLKKSKADQKVLAEKLDECHQKLLAMMTESESYAIRLHETMLVHQGFKEMEEHPIELRFPELDTRPLPETR